MDDHEPETLTGAGEAPSPAMRRRRNSSKKFALAVATLSSMSSILLGYDVGVMSGAVLFIKEDLGISDTQIEILVGTLNLYALAGSILAGKTSDALGRRRTIVISAALFFAGALLMSFATNYAFLMCGRAVAGAGVGFAIMIAPVYTSEISPAAARGLLASLPEFFINLGILLGYVSNVAFAPLRRRGLGWRLMLGVGAVPSVLLAASVLVMPESPRWLVRRRRLPEALQVLETIIDGEEEARRRLDDIKLAAGIPREEQEEVDEASKPTKEINNGVLKELLIRPKKPVQRALFAVVGLFFFQQASGVNSVVLFGPRVFQKAGIHRKSSLLAATVAIGATKTAAILVATFLLDRIGRRPLLLVGTAGMVASAAVLGLGMTLTEKTTWGADMAIAGVMAYVACFSVGMGPVQWVYGPEVLPIRLRAQGMSIAVAAGAISGAAVTMSFISLYKAITIGGAFFLYGGVAAVAWVFFYVFLPETRGKTLEELEGLFTENGRRS